VRVLTEWIVDSLGGDIVKWEVGSSIITVYEVVRTIPNPMVGVLYGKVSNPTDTIDEGMIVVMKDDTIISEVSYDYAFLLGVETILDSIGIRL
jgi:hypothetical protein